MLPMFVHSISLAPGRYSRLDRVAASKRWRWREDSIVDVKASPSRGSQTHFLLVPVTTAPRIAIDNDDPFPLVRGHLCSNG